MAQMHGMKCTRNKNKANNAVYIERYMRERREDEMKAEMRKIYIGGMITATAR